MSRKPRKFNNENIDVSGIQKEIVKQKKQIGVQITWNEEQSKLNKGFLADITQMQKDLKALKDIVSEYNIIYLKDRINDLQAVEEIKKKLNNLS